MGRRPTLVAQTNVGPGIGAGHLGRCLALAEAWRSRGGDATIVVPELPAPWDDRVAAAGLDWLPVAALPDGADWYVADDYRMAGAERRALKERGRLLVIDDFGESGPITADVVLDQNAGASAADYPAQRALLGARYALLRSDLIELPARPARPAIESVLVGLGGFPSTELQAFADEVLDAWSPDADLVVLDGRQDVRNALLAADLAFAAAGSFCWELCRAGVPAVVVPVNRNQQRLSAGLVASGAAVGVGAPAESNVSRTVAELIALSEGVGRRSAMGAAGRALVDGRGAARVVAHLRSALVTLRDVTAQDAAVLFEWANDPLTRSSSFNSSPIDWDTHVGWLSDRLRSSSATQWIGSFDGQPIGLVRFDQHEDRRADIGVTVAPSRRGEGWSAALIVAGSEQMFSSHGTTVVRAQIKPDNLGSIRAFEAADFDERKSDDGTFVERVRRYGGA